MYSDFWLYHVFQTGLVKFVIESFLFSENYKLHVKMNNTHEGSLLFDTAAAKAVSGLCTFLALFITGHQVGSSLFLFGFQ